MPPHGVSVVAAVKVVVAAPAIAAAASGSAAAACESLAAAVCRGHVLMAVKFRDSAYNARS